MASKPFTTDRDEIEQMKEFPCMFNLSVQREIDLSKFKSLKNKLVEELQVEGDEFDEEEKIRNKNFLTWIHFNLDDLEEATKLNTEVVELTGVQNMTALGNRVYLSWYQGTVLEGQECLRKLIAMKSAPNFDKILATATAEQAYCYDRLGGGYHCKMAIRLYKGALQHQPDKALWQYGLGLVYRRMVNVNLNLSSPEKQSINEYAKMAAESLFKVADNKHAGNNLRSLAFAQLASLRQTYSHRSYSHIFRDQTLCQLCLKALDNKGDTIPAVLTSCGKSLKSIPNEVGTAIKLLETSVKIRDVNPVAWHHLGLSLIKKAGQEKKPKRATDDSARNKCGQLVDPTTKQFSGQQRQPTNFIKNKNAGGEVWHTTKIHGSPIHQERQQEEQHAERNRPSADASMSALMNLNTYAKNSHKDTPLSKEDNLVKRAIHAFQKSVSTSNGTNLSALLSLGQTLKRTGQLSKAMKVFYKLMNSSQAEHFHRVTLISALEEAGLCCLQLSETVDGKEKQDYEEKGKRNLTMAIAYAVELAKSMPELKGCENDVWIAFRKLSTKLEDEERSVATTKQKIELLVLAEKYEKVIPVIDELLHLDEKQINNEDIIKDRLTAYLEAKQYEEALTFMNILEMKEAVKTSDSWTRGSLFDLKMKVVLSALYERLSAHMDTQLLFQQLFRMTFGHCAGTGEGHSEDVPDSGSDLSAKRDVLFLFEEEELTDPNKGHATRFGRCLKHILSSLCGLHTEENLRGNLDFTPGKTEMGIQLEELLKYQLVVVVLDDENRSPEFEAMLERIPYCFGPHFRVLDIKGTNSPSTLPVLKPYKWMKVEDIGQLKVTSPGARGGAGVDMEDKPVQDVFQGDIEAVMKLFCFIIGKQWPHT